MLQALSRHSWIW